MVSSWKKVFQADGSYKWLGDDGRIYDPGQYQLVEWLAAGNVPEEVAYVAPVVTPSVLRVSKLKLRRSLRAAGMEALLDAFLSSDVTIQKDWDDAQELLDTDPLLVAAIPAFCQQANITEAQARSILEASQVD